MSVTRWKSHKALKRELALGLKPARRMTDAQVIHHRGELIRELRRQVREWKSAALFNNQTIRILAERVAPQPLTVTAEDPEAQTRHGEWNRIQKQFTVDRKESGMISAKRSRTRRLNLWRRKWQGSI